MENLFNYDEDYYLKENQDVAEAVINGIFKSGKEHFYKFGIFENRKYSSIKNTDFRTKYAAEYITGEGIEIGALHQPLINPNNAKIYFVDNKPYEELINIYKEIPANLIIKPDIICSGESLNSINDNKYCFVIANHVLEHMKNPILAILNWIRVLKAGGILYISIPSYDNFLDKGRGLTTFEHIIHDFKNPDKNRDLPHYYECAYYWGNANSNSAFLEYVSKYAFEQDYSIHFHVFDKQLLETILDYIQVIIDTPIKLLELIESEINLTKEYICIIKKL